MRANIIIALAATALVTGCPAPFSRPAPSEDEYKEQYLSVLDKTEIQGLKFHYEGAVGGYGTIARFQTTEQGIEKIRTHADRQEEYDPKGTDADETRSQVRHNLENFAGGRLPHWFDFPESRRLTVCIVERPASLDEHRPGHHSWWYIDVENKIVYFAGVGD